MSTQLDKLKKVLQANDSHLTKPRQLIFAELEKHPTITYSQLYSSLSSQIDRSTIYRTIDLFEELLVIRRLHIGWKQKIELSDSFSYHHHHITCTVCGTETPIHENQQLESLIRSIATSNNYTPTSHQLEIQATCQNCQTLQR